MSLPTGKLENQRLEFKSREILHDLTKVGRSVVSMLNASGGVIWIGVPEDRGRAITPVPVDKPEAVSADLLNHLLDTIEPRLLHDEVVVVQNEENPGVLEVRVTPGDRRQPYAQTKRGGRYFYVRVGSRTRDMTRDEVRQAFRDAERSTGADVKAVLIKARNEFATKPGLWCRVRPLPAHPLRLRTEQARKTIEELLKDPERSGNDRMAPGVSTQYYVPSFKRSVVATADFMTTTIDPDGGIDFWVSIQALQPGWKGHEKILHPHPLFVFPLSLFNFARTLYEQVGEDQSDAIEGVLVDFGIAGLHGWALPAGMPRSPHFMFAKHPLFEEEGFALREPIVFDRDEFWNRPGMCAFTVVRELYIQFGHADSAIPPVLDPVSGKLLFPNE